MNTPRPRPRTRRLIAPSLLLIAGAIALGGCGLNYSVRHDRGYGSCPPPPPPPHGGHHHGHDGYHR